MRNFFLAGLYKSTESYCCDFGVGMGVGVGVGSHFKVLHSFVMLWARQCQASYPVWGQVLLVKEMAE